MQPGQRMTRLRDIGLDLGEQERPCTPGNGAHEWLEHMAIDGAQGRLHNAVDTGVRTLNRAVWSRLDMVDLRHVGTADRSDLGSTRSSEHPIEAADGACDRQHHPQGSRAAIELELVNE